MRNPRKYCIITKRGISLCQDKNLITPSSSSWMLSTIARNTLISLRLNVPKTSVSVSALSRWEAQFRDNDGDIPVIGSGNYASEEERESARLRRELRDAQDALDVLKKAISILGKD